MKTTKPVTILMADDDPDDRMLMKKALEQNQTQHNIQFVENGVDLMDYLHQRGRYKTEKVTKPGLILLDLNNGLSEG